MGAVQSCKVLDFVDRAENLRRREILDTVEHVGSVLVNLRRDMLLIGLIQEMSTAKLSQSIGAEREHIEALARIQSTLEAIVPLLPPPSASRR